MKKLMILAVITTMSLAVFGQIDDRGILVIGRAERKVVPNEIYVSITLDENDSRGRIPLQRQENELINALRRTNIDIEKDVQVSGMGSAYETYLLRANRSPSSKTYQIKVTSAAQLNELFTNIEPLNVSNARVTKVSHSDLDKIYNELRFEAMQNAREIAIVLAQAVEQEAGAAISINDYSHTPREFSAGGDTYMVRAMSVMNDAMVPDYNIDYKEIRLNYSVNVRFAFK